MPVQIELFAVVLAEEGAEFSERELVARRSRVRCEIMTLIPAVNYLRFSVLEDYLIVDDRRRFCLKFCLIPTRQRQLFQDDGSKHGNTDYAGMRADAEAIKTSAEKSQIKIGELFSSFSILTTTDGSGYFRSPDSLSQQDEKLRRLMLARRGKPILLSFPDRDMYFQFKLLPYHLPEAGTRIVRAYVTSFSEGRADITVSDEFEESSRETQTYSGLSGSFSLNKISKGFKHSHWMLLAAAALTKRPIDAEVKVALSAVSSTPDYLELRALLNVEQLIHELELLLQKIQADC